MGFRGNIEKCINFAGVLFNIFKKKSAYVKKLRQFSQLHTTKDNEKNVLRKTKKSTKLLFQKKMKLQKLIKIVTKPLKLYPRR